MPEQHLFEYAVIRVVPRVEREEFLNAGIVLYCRDRQFLRAKFTIDEPKIRSLCKKIEIEELKEHLDAIERICEGKPGSGPIGRLDMASRFRWLTAKRSTIVQTSQVHPGFCTDPAATLDHLFEQLVT